jgi:acyl phosphate:glycerol-3-phosphate acyltransferase
MNYILVALSLLPFYLLGTFPTGYLIAKRAGVDIARHGSGNVGATNVGRVLGKKAGIITLAGDLFKGVFAVLISRWCTSAEWYHAFAALAVVLGHCFSLPPLLRGGKGVATSLGAILGLNPFLALGGVAVFGAVFGLKRIVSLASVTAALAVPLFALAFGVDDSILFGLVPIALVVVYRHRENLERLARGEEKTFKAS